MQKVIPKISSCLSRFQCINYLLLIDKTDRGFGWIGLGLILSDFSKVKSNDKQQMASLNEEARSYISKGLKLQPERFVCPGQS